MIDGTQQGRLMMLSKQKLGWKINSKSTGFSYSRQQAGRL
jgi:hypothetical protein